MPESTFTFNGIELSFAPETDIGISELRHIKQWYPQIGDYRSFTTAAAVGDPRAYRCIVWIAQKKAGVKRLREPMSLPDFSVGELMGSFRSSGITINKVVGPIHLSINGEEYSLDIEKHLTCKKLEQIQKWWPEIGTLMGFVMAIVKGDPDAMASVAWLVDPEKYPDPHDIEMSVGEVLDSYEFDEPEELEDPEPPDLPIPDGDEHKVDPLLPLDGESSSAAIQKNFGESTVAILPSSSESDQTSKSDDLI